MISLYLREMPPLVAIIKKSAKAGNWHLLQKALHKMIPSFSIIGICTDFESMARKVEEYAAEQKQTTMIPDLVLQLENIWIQVYAELKMEFNRLKNGIL